MDSCLDPPNGCAAIILPLNSIPVALFPTSGYLNTWTSNYVWTYMHPVHEDSNGPWGSMRSTKFPIRGSVFSFLVLKAKVKNKLPWYTFLEIYRNHDLHQWKNPKSATLLSSHQEMNIFYIEWRKLSPRQQRKVASRFHYMDFNLEHKHYNFCFPPMNWKDYLCRKYTHRIIQVRTVCT